MSYQRGGYQARFGFGTPTPPTLKALLIANLAVFALQIALHIGSPDASRWFEDWFMLRPAFAIGKLRLWQFVTYAFVHDLQLLLHIAFNMFMLWMLGRDVAWVLGRKRFLTLYFAAAVAGGICMIPWYNAYTLGASGAVFGVMAMFARLFPDRRILVMGIIPMKMKTFVVIIVAMEVILQLSGGTSTAHLAHLGGFAVGWYFLAFGRATQRSQAARERERMLRAEREEAEVRAEVDRLLAKVGREGLQSLTGREREFLKQTSKRFRK